MGQLYMNFKRFKTTTMHGENVNLPYHTICECNEDGFICATRKDGSTYALMSDHSENFYSYFLPYYGDDEEFNERASLYIAIKKMFTGSSYIDGKHISRKDMAFDRAFDNKIANKYRQINDSSDKDNFVWDRYKLAHITLEDARELWDLVKNCKDSLLPTAPMVDTNTYESKDGMSKIHPSEKLNI